MKVTVKEGLLVSTTTAYRRGDTAPPFTALLLEEDGSPSNLVGATVQFTLFHVFSGKTVVNQPAAIVDVATAAIQYDWVPGDLFNLGQHEVEVEVTDASGKVRTFPADGPRFLEVFTDRGGLSDPAAPRADANGNDYQVAVGCDLYSPI